MLLLAAPFFYLIARLFPLGAIIVLERLAALSALRRCWTMTAGNAGPVMIFLVLLTIALMVASLLVAGVGAAVASLFTVVGLKAVGGFAAALITATLAMLVTIATTAATTVVYLRLK